MFLSGLQKLEQRAKKCIEVRGEYVEQIPSLFAVLVSFLVGLRTYQHPLVYLHGEHKDFTAGKAILS